MAAPTVAKLHQCLRVPALFLLLWLAPLRLWGEMPAAPVPRALAVEELDWVADQRFPGVQAALLWRDAKTGEQAMLRRFPAGFTPPRHAHPEAERIVVISGTVTTLYPGQPPKRLGPGAFSEIPPHAPHQARCEPGADCLFVLISTGPYQVQLAPEPR